MRAHVAYGHVACTARAAMERNADIRSRIIGPNVPRWERIACVLIGGGLAGISANLLTRHRRRDRHPVIAAALAMVSAGLVVRGIAGRSGLYRMRSVRKGIEVRRTITIQCTPMEVYELWRDLRNLPRFMQHVKSVEVAADGTSRWIVQEGPKTLEWRAEITEDTPGRRIRWRSLEGGDIEHHGILDLVEAPGGRGTIVDVRLRFRPPGGLLVMGTLAGFLRRLPGPQLAEELARLRMLIETGELATGARNPGELEANEKIATRVGV